METVGFKEAQQIIDLVKQKLDFAINPRIYELKVFPQKFMHVPSFQRFEMSPYKFKRAEGPDFVLYSDGESIIKYNKDSIEIFIKTRYSRRVYHYTFYNPKEVPYVLRPRFSDLVVKNQPVCDSVCGCTPEQLVKKFIALHLDLNLGDGSVLKQGHLYAIKIDSIENYEQWFVRERYDDLGHSRPVSVREIFGHVLNMRAFSFTDEIYYYENDVDTPITHNEHGTAVLPPGKWILYHPRPSDKVD